LQARYSQRAARGIAAYRDSQAHCDKANRLGLHLFRSGQSEDASPTLRLYLTPIRQPPDEIFALILQYLREELASNFGPRFFQYLRRRSKFGNLASTQKSYLIGDLMSKSHLMRHDHDIAALLP
jgi:hypothetical protein